MKRFKSIAALVCVLVMPQTLWAQDGTVKLVKFDDGFSSYVYAYARAEADPVSQFDGRGIIFGRDPVLAFGCVNGTMTVVYRFDTELLGEDNAVRVEYRFDDQSATEAQMWNNLLDPIAEAEMDAAALMFTGDSAGANPVFEMFASMALAAQIPSESALGFLSDAQVAKRVTIRVTDVFDGETHTDVFPLTGFGSAMGQMTEICEEG